MLKLWSWARWPPSMCALLSLTTRKINLLPEGANLCHFYVGAGQLASLIALGHTGIHNNVQAVLTAADVASVAQGRQHGLLEFSVRPSRLAAARAAAAGAADGDALPDQGTLALHPLTFSTLSAGQSVRGCAPASP